MRIDHLAIDQPTECVDSLGSKTYGNLEKPLTHGLPLDYAVGSVSLWNIEAVDLPRNIHSIGICLRCHDRSERGANGVGQRDTF
jgi:hypothetical protein